MCCYFKQTYPHIAQITKLANVKSLKGRQKVNNSTYLNSRAERVFTKVNNDANTAQRDNNKLHHMRHADWMLMSTTWTQSSQTKSGLELQIPAVRGATETRDYFFNRYSTSSSAFGSRARLRPQAPPVAFLVSCRCANQTHNCFYYDFYRETMPY